MTPQIAKKKTGTRFKPGTCLDQMLDAKSFEELLADGDIFDVPGAAQRSGYSEQHIRRLCREERIPCIRRGPTPEEIVFYFYPWDLAALFRYQKARAQA